MRSYGKLYLSMWRNDGYRALTALEQWLYEALVSQPDLTAAGAIPYRPNRWARLAADMTVETIRELVGQLEQKRYLIIDWDTEEVILRTFIRHDDGTKNPKMRSAISTAITNIESDALRAHAETELANTPGGSASDHQSDHQSDQGTDQVSDLLATATLNTTCSSNPPAYLIETGEGSPYDVVAAAIDILVEHRARTCTTPIGNRKGYATKIHGDEMRNQGEALIDAAKLGRTAEQIAITMLGVPPSPPRGTARQPLDDLHSATAFGCAIAQHEHDRNDPPDPDSLAEQCQADHRTERWVTAAIRAYTTEHARLANDSTGMATVHQLRGETA